MKFPNNMDTVDDRKNGLCVFHSPTHGRLYCEDVVLRLISYLKQNHNQKYKLIIGTDSELENRFTADFVTAIVVHRIGRGGIYFWTRSHRNNIHSLRQRMWEEANQSLVMANFLIEQFKKHNLSSYNLEIHVDVGQNGDTREMINELVGMIRGNGFEVKTKPDAFGASNVADRHT